MIILSGKIYVRPGSRNEFLKSSLEAVAQARRSRGCRDFVVAADPIEPERVNVYEEWDSEEALLTFRGAGPDDGLTSSIVRADVSRHVVASSGPP
jgi:quinol monooxygenase YgiN